ncbi:hypothetical protein JSE7799_01560 [Jannaschia seosinensis]|uniref:Uncharacterized protein n=1 Tax=Jannaschia seosinensis TaxID=313367 RepID=A0A0M7BAJ7_9RHOB|nr:hypothetical protein [Jannaschia seosinensis]CUH38842.1 hypothetical protein JSE7799_01560 [Jannaschia seosinensis]
MNQLCGITHLLPSRRAECSYWLSPAGPAAKGLDAITIDGIEGPPATLAELVTILPEEPEK